MAPTQTDSIHFCAGLNTSERRNARDRLKRDREKLANPGFFRRMANYLRTCFFPPVGV